MCHEGDRKVSRWGAILPTVAPDRATRACAPRQELGWSCRATFDNKSAKLLGLSPPICPLCLSAMAQGNLADLVTTFLRNSNALIYCAGTTPLPAS
jgi:hypothetical protein